MGTEAGHHDRNESTWPFRWATMFRWLVYKQEDLPRKCKNNDWHIDHGRSYQPDWSQKHATPYLKTEITGRVQQENDRGLHPPRIGQQLFALYMDIQCLEKVFKYSRCFTGVLCDDFWSGRIIMCSFQPFVFFCLFYKLQSEKCGVHLYSGPHWSPEQPTVLWSHRFSTESTRV